MFFYIVRYIIRFLCISYSLPPCILQRKEQVLEFCVKYVLIWVIDTEYNVSRIFLFSTDEGWLLELFEVMVVDSVSIRLQNEKKLLTQQGEDLQFILEIGAYLFSLKPLPNENKSIHYKFDIILMSYLQKPNDD